MSRWITPTNLSHFQLYASSLPRKRRTQASTLAIATDVVQFNKSVLATMLATRNEPTVIIKKTKFSDYGNVTRSTESSGTIAQILQESDAKGVFVAR